jgi:hypothetical protein
LYGLPSQEVGSFEQKRFAGGLLHPMVGANMMVLLEVCTMPHRNNPNDIVFDFIENRYGDMITSR